MRMVGHHVSKQPRYTQLEVINYDNIVPPKRVSVLEVVVENVQAGDHLVIHGQVEVTNNLHYPVEVCRKVTLEESTGGIGGTVLIPELGHNVTPQTRRNPDTGVIETFFGEHHGEFTFSGDVEILVPRKYWFVSVVMYAGGSSYTEPGDMIIVEQSTNILTVRHERKGWWEI